MIPKLTETQRNFLQTFQESMSNAEAANLRKSAATLSKDSTEPVKIPSSISSSMSSSSPSEERLNAIDKQMKTKKSKNKPGLTKR